MVRRRRRREFWERLVAEAVGNTVAETAKRHGVRPNTLKWWKWHLGTERVVEHPMPKKVALLPIVLSGAQIVSAAPQFVTIDLGRDLAIRVPIGVDAHYVAELVAAMRSSC